MASDAAVRNALTSQACQWRGLTLRAGRNDLPTILAHYWADLAVEDKPTALSESWGMAEYPESHIDPARWISMFNDVGYVVDGEAIDRDDDPELPAVVTLWRGCSPDRSHGMSWSLDRDVALWFANRWNGLSRDKTQVYRIEIRREFVLARITMRAENEVIVNTSTCEVEQYYRDADSVPLTPRT